MTKHYIFIYSESFNVSGLSVQLSLNNEYAGSTDTIIRW